MHINKDALQNDHVLRYYSSAGGLCTGRDDYPYIYSSRSESFQKSMIIFNEF